MNSRKEPVSANGTTSADSLIPDILAGRKSVYDGMVVLRETGETSFADAFQFYTNLMQAVVNQSRGGPA